MCSGSEVLRRRQQVLDALRNQRPEWNLEWQGTDVDVFGCRLPRMQVDAIAPTPTESGNFSAVTSSRVFPGLLHPHFWSHMLFRTVNSARMRRASRI